MNDPPPSYATQAPPPLSHPGSEEGYRDPRGPGYGYDQPMDYRYGQTNTIVVSQPAPQSTVILTQTLKPPNFLGLAIFVCLLCNGILGLIAIIFSVMSDSAYSEGNMEDARSKGRVSMWLSVTGMLLTAFLVVLILILHFTGVFTYYSYYG